MKRFLVFFFLSLSLVTIAAETQKIAIVNLEKVFDNYYKRAIAEEFFQQQSDIYRNYIVKQQQAQEKLQKDYELMRDASQNAALSITERESKRLEAEQLYRQLEEKKAEITQYIMEKDKELRQKQREKRDEIVAEITQEVSRRATLDGYTLVLDSTVRSEDNLSAVIFSTGANDLTDQVIEELNRGQQTETKIEEKSTQENNTEANQVEEQPTKEKKE